MKGFVKFRRGIVQHLRERRMTPDEFAAYSVMILCADHRTGVWHGCAKELSTLLHVGKRKAQRVMRSLKNKEYISLPIGVSPQGCYPVSIEGYFNGRVTKHAPEGDKTDPVRVTNLTKKGDKTDLHNKEVLQEGKAQEQMQDENLVRSFRKFYETYPEQRRGDETFTQVEWNQLPLIERDIEAILSGLEAWKKSDEWREAGGRYIPEAANFLKKRKWKQKPRGQQKEESNYERSVRLGYR